jgi:phosphotransferase system enzyme I (PtsI)
MQPGALLDVKEIILDADVGDLQHRTAQLFAHLDDIEPTQLVDTLNQS